MALLEGVAEDEELGVGDVLGATQFVNISAGAVVVPLAPNGKLAVTISGGTQISVVPPTLEAKPSSW